MGKSAHKQSLAELLHPTSKAPEYRLHTFPNGIRLIHKQVFNTRIAHCGILLDIGSRDEKPDQWGMAHFWEHMAFKGTHKRKAFHILNRLDSLGGELNAYTTKEKICFYASVLAPHFDKAAELLADISFHSTFPEKEIEKEKGVILEEMTLYEDDPQDSISDEFDELIFPDHPFGVNILGTREQVGHFQQADFFRFLRENLDTERLVFSSVGPLPFEAVLKTVEKWVKDIPAMHATRQRVQPISYRPQNREHTKEFSQAYCVLGARAHSLYQEDRIAFYLLINLLGGPGMNSRLNLSIREKYGFVYDIAASLTSFTDTGLFSIQFASDEKALDKCVKLVEKELKKLRDEKLGVKQLHSARQQLMGQLAMSEESNLSLMLVQGKNILDKNETEPLSRLFQKIEKISAEQLFELANHYFDPNHLSRLIYWPEAE